MAGGPDHGAVAGAPAFRGRVESSDTPVLRVTVADLLIHRRFAARRAVAHDAEPVFATASGSELLLTLHRLPL